MPSDYLVLFAQVHDEFRIPELLSVSELYKFKIGFPPEVVTSRPFMILSLESEEHALILAKRCILVKSLYELYASGTSYEEVHEQVRRNHDKWSRYVSHTTFKFSVTGYANTIPQDRQRDVINSFRWMDLRGKIDMKNPEVTFVCHEEYVYVEGNRIRSFDDGNFIAVYFGRLLADGSARPLIRTFNVKTRQYYGNTSMDAEISLLMANQALAAPGRLMYDPFVGTGSMAYTCAHFGSLFIGSDIDGRQMRGKSTPLEYDVLDGRTEAVPAHEDDGSGIIRSANQYGVASRIVDLLTVDVTQHPWRSGGLFDAIVTDPPYGVRAGAKRLGRKKTREIVIERVQTFMAAREFCVSRFLCVFATFNLYYLCNRSDQPYTPPTKPYELSELISDLVLFSRAMLKPQGRLVFFLPTVTEEYEEIDIETMMCDGMEVVANSLQNFGNWGRRLITIKKCTNESYPPPILRRVPEMEVDEDSEETGEHIPAHKDFRVKYFQGFKKSAP
ncbi:tRNA guanosine-2'-O-methyltransferase [Thelephora ganbajun]|uniref:tRNA guanosine-2'-O-methyltransferase n=1 Tax=Thelephora ganbajun TaxID=370292 RepID=A0ACB6Z4C9_THEGA|nr:tRNA guanosine-2'-O-methyltransferase [Thelephora ganbajun]